jgi:hypothetical protein
MRTSTAPFPTHPRRTSALRPGAVVRVVSQDRGCYPGHWRVTSANDRYALLRPPADWSGWTLFGFEDQPPELLFGLHELALISEGD